MLVSPVLLGQDGVRQRQEDYRKFTGQTGGCGGKQQRGSGLKKVEAKDQQVVLHLHMCAVV